MRVREILTEKQQKFDASYTITYPNGDITYTGFYVYANSEKEAEKKAKTRVREIATKRKGKKTKVEIEFEGVELA